MYTNKASNWSLAAANNELKIVIDLENHKWISPAAASHISSSQFCYPKMDDFLPHHKQRRLHT